MELFDKDNDGLISYYEYKQQHAQQEADKNQEQIRAEHVTTQSPVTVKYNAPTAKPTVKGATKPTIKK